MVLGVCFAAASALLVGRHGEGSEKFELLRETVSPWLLWPAAIRPEIVGTDSYLAIRGWLIPATLRMSKSTAREGMVSEPNIFKGHRLESHISDSFYLRYFMGGFDAAARMFHRCPHDLSSNEWGDYNDSPA